MRAVCSGLQLKTEPGLGGVLDGMNVKTLEERSEGDVASPSSTGTQVRSYPHRSVQRGIFFSIGLSPIW